ncbi:hypothetical protein PAXRUDRAFT_18090 [Paxillus rubicundulus Ve08.2h10]|uniref:Uncharacterized protein n=1 Tax=Paxillus rubicundulus Ve08.2h10 TaxID=930991 RepID=A0A0D0CZ91_9AGAM|nr:hypothetical protein PAXRUDRAFT_18090 [Paxillus rubicundulus Ve08.2h10]
MDDLETSAHALLRWIIVVQGVLRGPTQKDFVRGPTSKFHTASPYLHEEQVPTMTSPDSKTCGTEARSLETIPENQTLEPNLESPSNPITSNGSPDVDMVDSTDLQPSASLAIAGSVGSGAEAIPHNLFLHDPCPLPFPYPSTIQVIEPTVKLVVETVIKCMTESAQGASGSCHIEAEESEVDEDDDDTPSKHRKNPGKCGRKNYLHDAFHKYLEEKGVKKHRKDLMLPKSTPPDSVREFNATNNHPPTLSDLMINWSSSLLAPGWNTEVIQLLTVDFQQRLKNGTYPFVIFDEGKMNLLELCKLCIEKLHHTHREKQDRAKLDTTDITARKERHHKLNRMTTRKHGTLARQRRIIDENCSRDPDTWDDIRQIIDCLDIEGISGNETDTAPGTQPKVIRRMVLPWLSPFISELFDCVESYNTALHEECMTVHTGNSSLERMFEPHHTDTKAVALDQLPRNWYDEEWYKAHSVSGRTMLSAHKDVPIPTLHQYAAYHK